MKATSMISAAAFLSTAMCSNVSAQFESISGANLKMICGSYVDIPSNTSDGMCLGYVVGIVSVLEYMNVLCMPLKSTHSQATLVVQKYLSDHPEKLHMNAEELVFDALQETFPCTDLPTL
jgi:hypothetical protein